MSLKWFIFYCFDSLSSHLICYRFTLFIDISALKQRKKGRSRSFDQRIGMQNYEKNKLTDTTKFFELFQYPIRYLSLYSLDTWEIAFETETPEPMTDTPATFQSQENYILESADLSETISTNETNLWKEILEHEKLLQSLITKRMENNSSIE